MKSKLMIGFFALTTGSFGLVGCGGGGDSGEVTQVEGTNNAKYATASIMLPTNPMTFGFDLDGDGTAENKLGTIVGGLKSALNINAQTTTDDLVMKGKLVILLDETSSDATQQDAKNAGVKLSIASPTASPPKYDGTDTFMQDANAPAQFLGNIVGGTFTSNNPATTTNPVNFTLVLPLIPDADPLVAPVTAGRITFKRGTDGKITGGQINGAIKKEDVDATVLPSVAMLITKQIQAPNASATEKMFDTNMDGTVTVDELKSNSIIQGFLGPDIQLFQNGVYKPNPDKTMKDSLSLGLSFTAVGATF